ncbi:MAG: aminoglycoside phosphotransferase family enzyme/predicted kinase [Myxococcota bacterium]|jgi:aminoglycoside phosphotransferase family enzyme/predicted kinase
MKSQSDSKPSTDEIAQALAKNSDWVHDGAAIEWIQTHISHVFMVRDRVFKLRKSVRLPFLDFSSREARNADCLREIALNRRLAPDVYLGVAPILFEAGRACVGKLGESVANPGQEHVVVMRRLPTGRDALSLLENDELRPTHLEAVAQLLSRFHTKVALEQPLHWTEREWLERTSAPMLESLFAVTDAKLISASRSEELESQVRSRLLNARPHIELRRLEGRAVDAHGDLHLDHIWFDQATSTDPLMIDCIEFNEDLRKIDSASEVAFLAMDLAYRGRSDLADYFLAAYAMSKDDYGLFTVVDLFVGYRALVRAKVAALASKQSSIAEAQRAAARSSIERHIALTEQFLEDKKAAGIVLICGTVGSGKTTVARYLAQTGHGIPISSDRVRKSLAGLPPTTHPTTIADEGIYAPSKTDDVYRALLERAQSVVESGRTALLDASFSRRWQRALVRSWALERGIAVRLIEVRCKRDTAISRLEARWAAGTDASDAGPDFLSTSEDRFEAPDEWPASDHEIVWTD